MRVSVTEDINGMKYVRVTPDPKPKTLKTAEQIAQELKNHKPIDKTNVMYDETWEDYMRGRL